MWISIVYSRTNLNYCELAIEKLIRKLHFIFDLLMVTIDWKLCFWSCPKYVKFQLAAHNLVQTFSFFICEKFSRTVTNPAHFVMLQHMWDVGICISTPPLYQHRQVTCASWCIDLRFSSWKLWVYLSGMYTLWMNVRKVRHCVCRLEHIITTASSHFFVYQLLHAEVDRTFPFQRYSFNYF